MASPGKQADVAEGVTALHLHLVIDSLAECTLADCGSGSFRWRCEEIGKNCFILTGRKRARRLPVRDGAHRDMITSVRKELWIRRVRFVARKATM
jgi:hypothetical protein